MEEMTMSLKDVAEATNLHTETVRRLAQAGRLPGAVRTKQGWRMSQEDVAAFLAAGGARPVGRPARKMETPHA